MKQTIIRLTYAAVVCMGLYSCSNTPSNETAKTEKQSMEHTYSPGENWKLNWSDEFDAEEIDDNNWTQQVLEAGHFNEEWQAYTDSSKNAYVENGSLVIKAIHESSDHAKGNYSSARLHTGNKQSWKYGKIAARIKLPHGQGMWPAFWMLGANIDEVGGDTPWPQSGEIDIFELYGSKDDAVIEANMHYANSSESHAMMGAVSYELEEGIFADDYHVFELEWDAANVVWSVDGKQYASKSIASEELSEFHKEFYILLNVAVGGTWAGSPDASTVFPQHMYVDWVRVYEKM